ncbi:MAG: CHAT domain-containing tetratricopeptide repeat protein [Maribacter sp.]|uniref:CHAT domain-containing protein n=1 Tax=Maribacter sp. TaxID=1897614 RepID=UPI003298D622
MAKITFYALNNLILMCILLTVSEGRSQSSKDASITTEIIKIDSLIDVRAYDAAIVLIKEAVSTKAETAHEELAQLYNKLSFCQLSTNKFDFGKESAEKAMKLSTVNKILHKQEAEAYFNLGFYYELISKTKEATTFLKKSLTTYSRIGNNSNHEKGKIHLKLAKVFGQSFDLKLTAVHLDTAYTFLEQVAPPDFASLASYHSELGRLEYIKGSLEKGLENYTKAMDILLRQPNMDQKAIATTHSSMAAMYLNFWEDEKALHHLSKSQEIYLEQFGENYLGHAFNYQMFGMINSVIGQYGKSIDYLERALNLFKDAYGEFHPRVGLTYHLMANTHLEMQKNEQAIKIFKKGLAINEKTLGENHNYVFAAYAALGTTYFKLENYQEALKYLKVALKKGTIVYGADNLLLSSLYLAMGNTLGAMNEDKDALEMYEKALSIALKFGDDKSRKAIAVYLGMANFYLENQQFDASSNYYDKVINLFEAEITEFIETGNHTVEFNILPGILAAVKGKGKCLLLKYTKNGDPKDLTASNTLFDKSELFLEKVRRNIVEPTDRINFIAKNQDIRLGSVETSILLNEHDKNQHHLEIAFLGSERNKAGSLQDLIYRSSILKSDIDLKETRKFETSLKREKATILSNLKTKKTNSEKDTTRLETYENRLFQISLRNDSLLAEIQKNHPKYYAIEYDNKPLTVHDVQIKLDANTTLIEYFEGDSTLYAFVITKNSFTVSEFSSSGLTSDIEEFRTAIHNKNLERFKITSGKLYKNLVAPFETELIGNKLIVIPDGAIWHLNFDLLLTEQSASKNPKELPYLLRDYAISYSNSASYLYGLPGQNMELPKECLAFSYSDSLPISTAESISLSTLRNSKKDLPGSRLEITEIAKIIEGDYYYGSKASESNFKKNANKYGILHLAVHGEVNEQEPENSRLYFTKSNDSIEDGFLYGHELFAMNLPAELTVLSACSTGIGEIAPGEGMMSLGSAFQYAGSKSLLMTHWEVSDEIAPQIMKLFYTNLKNGMDKATALQQAKIGYLKTSDVFRSNPFYWGSFYIVGDTAPISLNSSNIWVYLVLGVLLAILGVFFFKRFKLERK